MGFLIKIPLSKYFIIFFNLNLQFYLCYLFLLILSKYFMMLSFFNVNFIIFLSLYNPFIIFALVYIQLQRKLSLVLCCVSLGKHLCDEFVIDHRFEFDVQRVLEFVHSVVEK